MSAIGTQLDGIRARIAAACSRSGRIPDDVKLVAVSKTFPAEDIREAFDLGQMRFGESRLQEAEPKVAALPNELEWHFIGRVQRNKVRKILPHFPYIHAVDSIKLATHIDGVAADLGLRPKIFLQINQASEESKGGFDIENFSAVMEEIRELKQIEPVGLMTIPPVVEDPEDSRKWFAELKRIRDGIEGNGSPKLPFLSMGMSGDFEVAVEEGATHIRVGSAIFGKRGTRIEGELG